MTDKIDLHIHSVHSDGILKVDEIFRLADKKKIKAISITDHDTIASQCEAIDISGEFKFEYIPGIEISANIGIYEIHILGYFINTESKVIKDFDEYSKKARYKRAQKIVKNLQSGGYKITIDEVLDKATTENIIRPHIANVLIEKGYCRDLKHAFNTLLSNKSKFYVKKYDLPPKQAVKIIHEAGGLAFWAHPVFAKNLKIVFNEVMNSGIDGLETYHTLHTKADQEYFSDICKKNDLLESGGSDCHGGAGDKSIILGNCDAQYSNVTAMKNRLGL